MKSFFTFLALLWLTLSYSQDAFITTWKTDNPGVSGDNQITIPTFPEETYEYTIDWGDGNSDANITGDITHTYYEPGIYQVAISGTFPRIYFNESGDREKVLNIKQWGAIIWNSMESAFAGCSNLSVGANDAPNLSNVTSLRRMFFYCNYAFSYPGSREYSNFNGVENFNTWNVSTITDMSNLFDKSAFGQDISSWNVNNVTDMSYLFFSTQFFNHDISNWNVGNVVNMIGTFGSSSFKQDVTDWDVSNVTNMDFMFNSTYFDQDISSWDVSNVTSMRHMLSQCSFNQDISTWNVSNVGDMSNIFDDNDLSRENYDKILIAWSQLSSLKYGITLGAKDVQYCASKDAREALTNINGWNIIDQGENCEEERAFITTWKTDNPGPSENNQITIPTNPREVYNYNVDWGDGTTDTNITEDITHTYDESGIYQVSITGRFPRIYFNNSGEPFPVQYPQKIADTKKIISVDQWGSNRWNSMDFAFAGCSNLDITATDIPDFSKDIMFSYMFYNCTSLLGNESMSQWDLSPTSMTASGMFSGATQFNQSIGNWDVSNIRYLDRMFENATSFNQNLGHWNIGKVENMNAMFDGSGLSIASYDKILNAWSALPNLIENVKLGATNINFCNSTEERQNIINNYNWEINDAGNDCSSTYFITTWKTDNSGVSEDNQITIPTFPGETYDYTVDWGDGTSDTDINGDITHTYEIPGTYQVSIAGTFPRIYFYGNHNPGSNDVLKILTVNQWGTITWTSFESAFEGCSNLEILAQDIPNLSLVSSLKLMFDSCANLVGNSSINNWDVSNVSNMDGVFANALIFNQSINGWDTSSVTTASGMFFKARSFNQPLNSWNVSNVEDMSFMFGSADKFNQPLVLWNTTSTKNMNGMFDYAIEFNQPLDSWNVSNVENMQYMFLGARSFNQPLNSWNVSKVSNMYGMFQEADKFNQPLNSWNVSNVENMSSMFWNAPAFNQNLGNWDVSKVITMNLMFKNALSFNQSLSTWNISNVTNMYEMLLDAVLSTENYDNTLNAWASLSNLQDNVFFGSNNHYCQSTDARQFLVDNYGWTITDGGKDALCNQDNDLDGVLDHKDNCLDTRPNVTVNENGCEIIASDAILIYGTTPTCPGEANGNISISSTLVDYTFNISIDGPVSSEYANSSLNEPLEITNLSAGAYNVTISIPDVSYSQTYGIQINEVGSISGKRDHLDTNSKSASYTVEGSYSYKVDLNGAFKTFQFNSDGFNEIRLSDLEDFNTITISGESDCQGLISDSFSFSDGIVIYPTITKNDIHIQGYEDQSTVLIYDSSGRLLISKKLTLQNLESVDLIGLEPGIYPTLIESKGNSRTFKIIKQ